MADAGVTTSVTVQGPHSKVIHDKGSSIAHLDGHLVVKNRFDKIIAIYAPGKWVHAEVTS
jgi:hypothetical protein